MGLRSEPLKWYKVYICLFMFAEVPARMRSMITKNWVIP